MVVVLSAMFIAILWLGFYEYVLKPGELLKSIMDLPRGELAKRIGAALIILSLSVLGAQGFNQSRFMMFVDVAIIGAAVWLAYNAVPGQQGQAFDRTKLRLFAKSFGWVQIVGVVLLTILPHSR